MAGDFDWTLMRSFLAVVEHGSLLGAARHLSSSQPTLGRHIAQLEQQLGVALFERTGRGLTPTAVALSIAEHARTMEGSAAAISRTLTGASETTTGTVRLTASQAVACYLLPPILARLRQHAPGITLELVSSNAVSNLLRREADIAVRMVRPDQASLIARRVGQVQVGCYATREYLTRHGTPRSAEDLFAHDLIGMDQDDTILRGFAAMGAPITREQFILRTDDHIAGWQAVRAGLGIGFGATYIGDADPQVVRLLPQLPVKPLPAWLTVHREIRASQRIRLVYDFLADEIREALK
jgi:DNA-binding transcriptional LysR family regulator